MADYALHLHRQTEETDRLTVLDGMRGLAAAMVMVRHLAAAAGMTVANWPTYLAVDFFFMLSGYVIARAFERRLRSGLGVSRFVAMRLRRLYPVMAIGILVCAVARYVFGMAGPTFPASVLRELVFIPETDGQLYFIDGVQWSLACEIIANAVHALILIRLNTRTIIAIALASLICLTAYVPDTGMANVGTFLSTFLLGLVRTSLSYCLGIAIYRLQLRQLLPSIRTPASLALVALAVCLLLPGLSGANRGWLEPLWVAAIFPVILLLGIHAYSGRFTGRAMTVAGAISYPLYALHLSAKYAVLDCGPDAWPLIIAGCAYAIITAMILAWLLAPKSNVRQFIDTAPAPSSA